MTTPRRYLVYLWLATSTLAALLCMYDLSATLVNGEFIPADQDSFYHARRILDSIPNPAGMYQFDKRIHSPEGSWITWPWAYDMAMAALGHMYVTLTGSTQPLKLLVFVAPIWVFVNLALILGITCELSLAIPLQVLAMMFYALVPLTRSLHRVGMLDHHFVEYTFVLATIFFGLKFFSGSNSRRPGIQLGVVLGMAPAFHNGLFILQLPILVTIVLLWLRGCEMPAKALRAFAVTLTITTFGFLLPSEPFRLGMFSFYLQSWFHLYIACCTSILAVLLSYSHPTRRSVLGLIVLSVLAALPLLSSMQAGGSWVIGSMPELQDVVEVESPWHAIWVGRYALILNLYTCLIFLAPVGLVLYLYSLRSSPTTKRIFFGVFMMFGLALLSSQIRLQYFGALVLALPWCILVNDRISRRSSAAFLVTGLGVTFAAGLAPAVFNTIGTGTPPATDTQFAYSMDIFKVLRSACRQKPGLVLAEQNDGHIVTYYSDCSVIANNFIMTPQHVQKIRESRQLLGATVDDALKLRPDIEYILIRRADPVLYTRQQTCGKDCPENMGLVSELLFSSNPRSDRLTLMAQSTILVEGKQIPFVRLFSVHNIAGK